MRDLCQCRLETLAVRMHADAQLESAVGRQARGRLLMTGDHRHAPARINGGAVRALLAINGKAEADQPAIRLAAFLPVPNSRQVERGDGTAQGLRIIAPVEMFFGDVI